MGMGRLPEDAEWLTMYYTDRKEGKAEAMGKIAVSIQIVPEEDAKQMPVGIGRNEPNTNPYLPPPVSRMNVSANPFLLMKELVGPKLCAKLFCLFCCGFCLGFISYSSKWFGSTLEGDDKERIVIGFITMPLDFAQMR